MITLTPLLYLVVIVWALFSYVIGSVAQDQGETWLWGVATFFFGPLAVSVLALKLASS